MPTTTLPSEIKVEDILPTGCRYILPRRELGVWRWSGLFFILFGVLGISFALHWFAIAAEGMQPLPGILPFIMGLFGIPIFFGMGCVPMAIGLAIIFGHSEIEVSSGKLRTTERVGMLRWRRSRRIDQVQRFVVVNLKNAHEGSWDAPAAPRDLACIRIEWEQRKLWLAAPLYPRTWVIALADALAQQCHLATEPESLLVRATAPACVEVVEEASEPGMTERMQRPAWSKVILEQTADGLTLSIPAAGLMKHGGCLFFSVIWLGFMTFVLGGALFAANKPQPPNDGVLGFAGGLACVGLFWVAGIAMLLVVIDSGRSRARIVLDRDRLMVFTTGIFSSKTQAWRRNELAMVCVGPSGMIVNDVPELELQIHLKSDEKVGLLSDRDKDELEWMATHLRRSLAMSPKASNPAANLPDRTQPPEKSRIVFEPLADGLTLCVPRVGLGPGGRAAWLFAFAWNAFMAVFTTIVVLAGEMGDGSVIFWILFLTAFWLLGLALVGTALQTSLWTVELAVSGGRLFVLQSGLLGKSKREFEPDTIACVRAGPSSNSVNGQPLIELQIVPREGISLTLLQGRDQNELAWIATMLRQALRVPAEKGAESGVIEKGF